MLYRYVSTDRIPKELATGVVYHNPEFELGALLCACGCGLRIDLLVPDSHQITSENGLATVTPSILVVAGPCRSHYFITAGRVEWANEVTEAQASALMQRQIARHAIQAQPPPKKRFGWLFRALSWLKSLFRRR